MSPAYREPTSQKKDDRDRSAWSTVGIYVVLVGLTILMGFVFHTLSVGPAELETPQEIRATR